MYCFQARLEKLMKNVMWCYCHYCCSRSGIYFHCYLPNQITKKFIFSLFSDFKFSWQEFETLYRHSDTITFFFHFQTDEKKNSRKWAASVDEDPVWQIY